MFNRYRLKTVGWHKLFHARAHKHARLTARLTTGNLVLRSHVSFGQHQDTEGDTEQTKRHVGSGNEIEQQPLIGQQFSVAYDAHILCAGI